MSYFATLTGLIADFNHYYWSYIGFTVIVISGLYFSFKSDYTQFRTLIKAPSIIKAVCGGQHKTGTHPLKLYFASIGGMIGLGNIASVTTAVTIGGAGSLLWLWVASLCGMLIKYAETFLGVTYREANPEGGYRGGPMYYLQIAFGNKWVPFLVAFFLCLYGVEIAQFNMIVATISDNFALPKLPVILILLVIILYTAFGGVGRLANIATILMPAFLLSYIVICIYIIACNYQHLFEMLPKIFPAAFTGQAAFGGFAGSTMWLAVQYGFSRAIYSGDIGLGYDAIINSNTSLECATQQAKLAIISLVTDTFICTLSCLLVLATGAWHSSTNLEPTALVSAILHEYIPFGDYYITFLFTLAGFTTIIAYIVIGQNCAYFIAGKIGQIVYYLYAIIAFICFSFYDQMTVFTLMEFVMAILVMINLSGIIKLRNEIKFNREDE